VLSEHFKRQHPSEQSSEDQAEKEQSKSQTSDLEETAVTKKRKILQKGGFLSAILTAAIPLLGGLIANAVRHW